MAKRLLGIVVIVALILLVPLLLTLRDGANERAGWNWAPADFLVMGAMLFITGLAVDFAVRKLVRPVHRFTAVAVIVLAFLALWAELAVGAVSKVLTTGF